MKNKGSERIIETLKTLRRQYTGGGVLEIGEPFAMVVAVLLSARTRDERVLKALGGLFVKYPTPEKMAKASVDDISKLISNIGLYKAKAKYVKALSQKLVEDFCGKVPETIEELVTLPGVGRKTASVVLVGAFGKQAIAVDTHVFRVVSRLGWAKAKTPEEMEKKLLAIVPEKHKRDVNHTMVPFGRAICIPGKPRCWGCPLVDLCDFAHKNLERPANADGILKTVKEKEEALIAMREKVKAKLV